MRQPRAATTRPLGANRSGAMGLPRMPAGLAPRLKPLWPWMAKRRAGLFQKSVGSLRTINFAPMATTAPGLAQIRIRLCKLCSMPVPDLKAPVLPPTAIDKDYPYEGDWFGLTASRTGAYASLGGYLGLTIGWVEGFEINFLGRSSDLIFADRR